MSDLTVRILEKIHEEIRGQREDHRELVEVVSAGFNRMDARFEAADARFEVLETSVRDLAQQLGLIGRGLHVALDRRAENDQRLEDHERRLADLEAKLG